MDLSTNYLGLKLRTPLVPSASPLSEEIDKIKQMEAAGAAAVVLHSLFEEQTETDSTTTSPAFRVTPETYLKHIEAAKRAVKIPIIASLNCTTLGGWIRYGREIAEAGGDERNLPGDGRDQNGDGWRGRDDALQRIDAARHSAYSTNRNGNGGLAGTARPQIARRHQGRDEPEELSGPQRLRAGAVRPRAFEL